MKISVVVCTYNRDEYIENCLLHLQKQNFSEKDYEIIIVNNNSTDHTDAICSKFKSEFTNLNVNYVIETNQGLSYARNRGIKEATGEIIAFVDDDAFAEENYVKEVDRAFNDHPGLIAAGGKVVPVFESGKPSWMSSYLMPLIAAIDMGSEIKPFPKGKFPVGANMLFRKSFFDKIGMFDVSLGRSGNNLLGSEEKDIFFRIGNQNARILYLPKVVVAHIVPAKRLQPDYIRKQAIGIGISEKLRVGKLNVSEKINKIVQESVKSIGTVVLACLYILTGRPAKGIFLSRFRFWVLKGYFYNLK